MGPARDGHWDCKWIFSLHTYSVRIMSWYMDFYNMCAKRQHTWQCSYCLIPMCHCVSLEMNDIRTSKIGLDITRDLPTHYCDVIMGAIASQITSLTIVYSLSSWNECTWYLRAIFTSQCHGEDICFWLTLDKQFRWCPMVPPVRRRKIRLTNPLIVRIIT